MNYEKKYKESLEKAKKELDACGSQDCDAARQIFRLFPELLESEDERIRKELITHCKNTRCVTEEGAERIAKWIAWLEKQCEQKSFDYENANIQQKDFAPKVEPKFKVGEWVVQENIGVYKVIEICESWYEVIDTEDNHYSISFDKEYMCHLWDISDAKNGDVLVTVDDNLPFIYKGCLDPNHPNSPFAYCGIYAEGNFSSNWDEVNRRWTDVKVQPATKEQRDKFEKAMTDAGFTFDFEKKELKKIKRCPMLSDFLNAEYEREKTDALKCAEWSEEDKEYLNDIIRTLRNFVVNGGSGAKKYTEEEINWLKSLCPQKQWKPSEEQIGALEHFVRSIGESGFTSPYDNYTKLIYSLLQDLKKLRKE